MSQHTFHVATLFYLGIMNYVATLFFFVATSVPKTLNELFVETIIFMSQHNLSLKPKVYVAT